MSAPARHAWQSAAAVGVILFVVYAATGASSLTFWDASEFATAIGTLGIPHPPGTPLYVSLGTTLWHLVPGISPVQAGTLLSVLSTSVACAAAAWLVVRITGNRTLAIIAGLCAGAMGTVWNNATETEVYAVALLCASLQLVAAWHAHAADNERARVLVAYLAALSIPLHLSALVAAPAAILLASTRRDGTVHWRALIAGGGLIAASVALSKGWLVGALLLLSVAIGISLIGRGDTVRVATENVRERRTSWVLRAAGVSLIAWSAAAILLVRARQSPFLNQGDPDTFLKLVDVLSRAQYDVAALWPRRAPLWLQFGNIVQYADWQVALGLWNDVTPSWWRTPFTVLAAIVGGVGAAAHWRFHRITARAACVLFLLATVGVCLQLNLRAGPSFGIGILAESALHEARERDYFFALAFWMWGLWIGVGAWVFVRKRRWPTIVGMSIPALLLAGNWSAITRDVLPDKRIATVMADGMLRDVPRSGMLFTAGDNDSYPLWYRQAVDSLRPDVQVVVTSLLPANWYFRESVWRASRSSADTSLAAVSVARAAVVARAHLDRRGAVAVSIAIPSEQRAELGRLARITCWRRVGLVDVGSRRDICPPRVDVQRTVQSAERLRSVLTPAARQSPDVMVHAFQTLAQCPSLAATAVLRGAQALDSASRRLLDITCNLR